MKAAEIRDTILGRAHWVDPNRTVDTFKHGDPDAEVRKVAVTWMLTMEAIEEAKRVGANVVVTHEPTFYDHFDAVGEVQRHEVYREKRRRLDQAGLTVLRIHDSWDTWPGIGIGDSLATLLGLKIVAQADALLKAGETAKPMTLGAFATFVRRKLKMDGVLVMGDPKAKVRCVGLCYGACGGLDAMQKFLTIGSDVILAGELCNWREIRYLQDVPCPLIVADHATTEEPGMRALAVFLRDTFRVPTHFIEVGACTRTWTK